MTSDIVVLALEQAQLRSRLLAITAGFRREEVEDARQDLLLDCLGRWSRFDARRGDERGFVRGVMRNQCSELVKGRARRVGRQVLFADIIIGEECIDLDHIGFPRHHDPTPALMVAIDVRRVLAGLPLHLQTVAWLLSDSGPNEVCRRTAKSRTWVYNQVVQLRTAFSKAGLAPQRREVRR